MTGFQVCQKSFSENIVKMMIIGKTIKRGKPKVLFHRYISDISCPDGQQGKPRLHDDDMANQLTHDENEAGILIGSLSGPKIIRIVQKA